MWNLERVLPQTYHVNLKTCKDLGMFFLRLQDFYLDDNLDNKFFTIDEFEDYYSKFHGGGEFNYYLDWQGYNMSSCQLIQSLKHYRKKMNNFRGLELESLKMVEFINSIEKSEWILIGTCGKSSEQKTTLNHEIAHSIFHFDKKYRASVKKEIKKVPTKHLSRSLNFLKGLGYEEEIILDELNAYWSTDPTYDELKIPLNNRKNFEEMFLVAKEKHIKSLR